MIPFLIPTIKAKEKSNWSCQCLEEADSIYSHHFQTSFFIVSSFGDNEILFCHFEMRLCRSKRRERADDDVRSISIESRAAVSVIAATLIEWNINDSCLSCHEIFLHQQQAPDWSYQIKSSNLMQLILSSCTLMASLTSSCWMESYRVSWWAGRQALHSQLVAICLSSHARTSAFIAVARLLFTFSSSIKRHK